MTDQVLYPNTFEAPLVEITYDRTIGITGWILLGFMTFVLIFAGIYGYFRERSLALDRDKFSDITVVVTALGEYYNDSSAYLEKRYYPISRCSSDLNSFDFEFTLKNSLIGVPLEKNIRQNVHPYLSINDFPTDKQGSYVSKFSEDSNFNCINAVPSLQKPVEGGNKFGYKDNSSICAFSPTSPNCYLYTSSANGDSFKIAYFSNADNQYVVFEKFRDENIKLRYSK
jgi:hypothetical protein